MQELINKSFFVLMLFMLIFGVIFYDMIDSIGFSYTDELCVLLVLILYIAKVYQCPKWEFNRTFLFVMGVFLFYLIYSIAIGSNVLQGILLDFFIQIKPYVSFFCVLALKPELSINQKKIIRQITLILGLYLLLVGLINFGLNDRLVKVLLGHESRFATAASILALLYLYCSDYTKVDKFVFVLLLAVGLFSGRSKLFGFLAICILMLLYMNNSFKMKFGAKNTFFILLAVALAAFVARDKIYFYFIEGGLGNTRATEDLYARMALYYFSLSVFMEYIPFGSGFASYATHASGVYYSPIYEKLYMNNMHGLTKADPAFIADTYYPALAQFGFVGVILFFLFWGDLAYKSIKAYHHNCKKEVIIALMIIGFFIIECTSDSTITHNRGIFLMMLLGMIYSDIKQKTKVDPA
jgi:hypothetical protein